MAYEGSGYTDWKFCADDVPVSDDLERPGQQLGPLNIDNLNHPEIARAPTAATASSGPSQDHTPNERAENEGTYQDGVPMLRWHKEENA
jgi:hypothetical protein